MSFSTYGEPVDGPRHKLTTKYSPFRLEDWHDYIVGTQHLNRDSKTKEKLNGN